MTAPLEAPDRLQRLSKKILRAKKKGASPQEQPKTQKNVGYAWRMVLELVIGMLFGFGIGFALDKWLNTAPLMMVVMSLFGFAAGIRTMMITANEFANLDKKNS